MILRVTGDFVTASKREGPSSLACHAASSEITCELIDEYRHQTSSGSLTQPPSFAASSHRLLPLAVVETIVSDVHPSVFIMFHVGGT
jgi:hypothetical protein